ncbi:hypothetical protein SAMN06265171_101362 [Chryseobacterium rhizoplanae]|uniref:Uncharacterized protein n=1 Tax=Chryseobacterium rhizoplanae TaxID=1609531 RepID=A0A521AQE6_9FLAO|nr:hypothetical protein [Chryseobacterium rhizoplanae]SMO37037.1 hypothetical protein SAMN06265171_101362 [Chryseobacterium rhizoplanae]
MSNIPQKIQKNIDNIESLKKQISGWKKLSDEELFQAVKEFEKTPRLEVSIYYNDLFNDAEFTGILLDIYKNNADNTKLVVLLISAIGNMLQRYNLPETKEIYEVMLENAYKKNVGPYVAIFLPRMEHFKNYSKKWQYFMEVKNMSPKKVAESSFEVIMDLFGSKIPEENKKEAANYFNKKAEESNNEYGKQYYLDLANKFK